MDMKIMFGLFNLGGGEIILILALILILFGAKKLPELAKGLGQGIKEFRNYLNQYAACQESGRWPGYADRIEPISIPRYALTAESQS